MKKFEGHVCRNVNGICDQTGVGRKSLSPDVDKFGNFKFITGSEAEYPVGLAAAIAQAAKEHVDEHCERREDYEHDFTE
eukprot:15553205-Heterocapsa_arctica.AAC.1